MRTRHYLVAILLVPALAGALGAGLFYRIGSSPKQKTSPPSHSGKRVKPAHGLMLYPLADPDGHVSNGR